MKRLCAGATSVIVASSFPTYDPIPYIWTETIFVYHVG
jgi:hypothetical protein